MCVSLSVKKTSRLVCGAKIMEPSTASKFQRLKSDASEEEAIKHRAALAAAAAMTPSSRRQGWCASLLSCCQRPAVAPLIASAESGAVALLRGSWLVALHERGGRISRRQDLPPEAFWTPSELRSVANALGDTHASLFFVAFSSSSIDKVHHDPDGFHLGVVAHTAKLYLGQSGYYSKSAAEKSPLALAFAVAGLGEEMADFALLWSWASVHQLPCTPEEAQLQEVGKRAALEHWFENPRCVVWLQRELPPHCDRSVDPVTYCEQALSSAADHTRAAGASRVGEWNGGHALDLSRRTEQALRKAYGGNQWPADDRLDTVCAMRRLPPLTAEQFERELARLCSAAKAQAILETSSEDGGVDMQSSDYQLWLDVYTTNFQRTTARLTQLDASGQRWDASAITTLGEALPRLTALRSLQLGHNEWDESLAHPLAEALGCAAKSGTPLTSVDLSHNEFGTEGARIVAPALAGLRSLCHLDLSHDLIKDEGAIALAGTLSSDQARCTALKTLACDANDIRAAGAVALAKLLVTVRSLSSLGLSDNLIKDDGAAAIAQTLVVDGKPVVARGGGLQLDLRSNGIGARGAEALGTLQGHVAVNLGTVLKRGAGVSGSGRVAPPPV